MKELNDLSKFIETRLEDLRSEIKEKYKFLKVNRWRELDLFDKDGNIVEGADTLQSYSLIIIDQKKAVGKIDYVTLRLDDK